MHKRNEAVTNYIQNMLRRPEKVTNSQYSKRNATHPYSSSFEAVNYHISEVQIPMKCLVKSIEGHLNK